MAEPARVIRPATYQDVLDAPPHQVAEVLAGTLYTHPRPAMRHARASSVIGAKVGSPFLPDPSIPESDTRNESGRNRSAF